MQVCLILVSLVLATLADVAAKDKRFIFSSTKIKTEITDTVKNLVDAKIVFGGPLLGGFTDEILQKGNHKRDVSRRGTTVTKTNSNKIRIENIFNGPLYGDIKALFQQLGYTGKRDVTKPEVMEKRGTTVTKTNSNKIRIENIFNGPLYGDIKALFQQLGYTGKRDVAPQKDKRFIFSSSKETKIIKQNTLNEIKKLNEFQSIVTGDLNIKYLQQGRRDVNKRFIFTESKDKTQDPKEGCVTTQTLFGVKVECNKINTQVAKTGDGCQKVKTAWGWSMQCNTNSLTSSTGEKSVVDVSLINGQLLKKLFGVSTPHPQNTTPAAPKLSTSAA